MKFKSGDKVTLKQTVKLIGILEHNRFYEVAESFHSMHGEMVRIKDSGTVFLSEAFQLQEDSPTVVVIDEQRLEELKAWVKLNPEDAAHEMLHLRERLNRAL